MRGDLTISAHVQSGAKTAQKHVQTKGFMSLKDQENQILSFPAGWTTVPAFWPDSAQVLSKTKPSEHISLVLKSLTGSQASIEWTLKVFYWSSNHSVVTTVTCCLNMNRVELWDPLRSASWAQSSDQTWQSSIYLLCSTEMEETVHRSETSSTWKCLFQVEGASLFVCSDQTCLSPS